jgi:hypothetical protein
MAKDLSDYYKEYHRKRYLEKKEEILVRTKAYREANRDKYREYNREGKKRNAAKVNASNNKRRCDKLKATPSWLSKEHELQILEIYKLAKERGWHVDHIVPLRNKIVCGLHVPWNLQPLDPIMNIRKSNKLESIGE